MIERSGLTTGRVTRRHLYFPEHCINGCEVVFGADDLNTSAPTFSPSQTLQHRSLTRDSGEGLGVSSAPNRFSAMVN
jgi:hypothetical protein